MKNNLSIIVLSILILGCSSKPQKIETSQMEREMLSELYEDGYSIKELSLRLLCPEEQIVTCIQDGTDPDLVYENLEELYNLNKDENIVPTNKIKDKITDCLWQIYTQTQNLPIMSQYTKIDVDKIANALIKNKTLPSEDSIKALIAFVNLKYKLDSIPKDINVAPYYRTNAELKRSITLPRDYGHTSLTDEQNAKISYYLWQAEEFEKKANANLVASINKKVNKRVDNATNDFINKDVDSYKNDIICIFKNDKDVENFYKEKLSRRVDIAGLQKDLRQEILSYCVSINCSRILLVSEMLNYYENVDNLSIAQKVELQGIRVRMNKINSLVAARRLNDATEAGLFAATFFIGGPGAGAKAGAKAGKVAISCLPRVPAKINNFARDLLIFTGLEKNVHDILGNSPLSIDNKTKDLKNIVHSTLKKKLNEQFFSHNNSYKQALNENTITFYNKVRTDLNIK